MNDALMRYMRTTVTLDPDVDALIKEVMRDTDATFKKVVNDGLRRGLAGVRVSASSHSFVVDARPMGLREGVDLSRIRDLEDELDSTAFLETRRRLEETNDS